MTFTQSVSVLNHPFSVLRLCWRKEKVLGFISIVLRKNGIQSKNSEKIPGSGQVQARM
jgi:hypothetical protein